MKQSCLGLIVIFVLLTACVYSAHAQSPQSNIQLRLESVANRLELVVNGSAPTGAFLVYQANTPQELAANPVIIIHTNTPLTNGVRFPISTPVTPTNQAFYKTVHYTNMTCIQPGTFIMGSPESEPARLPSEGPQTQVTISRAFCMGKCEVTQGEYLTVMGTNPSTFSGDLSLPVETVSWNDAAAYCAALTAKEQSEGGLPAGYAYRLPTEAEWEYACRAGTTAAFAYGSALRSEIANFNGRFEYPPCGGETYSCYNVAGTYLGLATRVGSYAPNPWGLQDMHGNVWEWCYDWFAESLPGGSVIDPKGPTTGEVRMVRGGSWDENAWGCRSANRFSIYPDAQNNTIGFRVVLTAL